MSANASNSAAGQHFVIVNGAMATYGNAFQAGLDPATGRVKLPDNRGYIQLNPGDYVAVDNTGAVIVVPVNSVSYTGTVWTFT
jgi:regulator of RNase E activity RraA